MSHHRKNVLFLFLLCLLAYLIPQMGTSQFCKESCESSALYGFRHSHKRFRIYLLTFSLGQADNTAILEDILFDAHLKTQPDMYVIALQELPYTNHPREPLPEHLNKLGGFMKKHNYFLVKTGKDIITQLAVFAADEHKDQLSNEEIEALTPKLPTATVEQMKELVPSIAARFTFEESQTKSSFCIVGTEFDPDDAQSHYPDRINNFKLIMDKLAFSQKPSKIEDHNYVIFMGNLNFRLQSDIDKAEILSLISNKQWPDLLKHDELKKAQKTGEAFKDYQEADIDFAPTYKLAQNGQTKEQQSHYDDNTIHKPAYTDRILARAGEHFDAREASWTSFSLSSYEAFEPSGKYKIYSDHRPVGAIYEVPLWATARVKTRNACYGNRASQLLK